VSKLNSCQVYARERSAKLLKPQASKLGPARAIQWDVNLGFIDISQPTGEPLSLAPAGAAAPFTSAAHHFESFLSLLHGLSDQSAPATGNRFATLPGQRISVPTIAKTSNTMNAVIKDRQEKTGKAIATSVRPGLTLRSALPGGPVPAVLAPTPTVNSPNVGSYGELLPIPLRAGVSVFAAASLAPAVALSNSPATVLPNLLATSILSKSMATGGLNTSIAPSGSPRDLAFGLQLTWQPTSSIGEAEIQPGLEASASVASIHSTRALTSNLLADNITVEKQATTQTSRPAVSQPPRERSPVESSFSLSPPPSLASTRSDLGLKRQSEFHPSDASGGSALQNRGATTGDSSTKPSFLAAAPTLDSPPVIEPIDTDRPSALLAKKTGAESSDLEASTGFVAAASDAQAETKPSGPEDRDRSDQSDVSLHLPPATSATAHANGSGPASRDLESAEGQNAGQNVANEAGNSESDQKSHRVSSTAKPAPQGNHDLPSLSADAVLLGRPPEPGGVPDTRAKARVPSSPAPTVAPETEATPVAPQPLREVSLRLAVQTSSVSTSNVDVQLAERAGKVQVAVRTADQELAKSLQGNLGELVGRLQERGFKTDVWTPTSAPHGGLATREPSTSSESQNYSDRSGSQGGQPDSRGQPGSDQRRQGHWKAEFEGTQTEEESLTPTRGASG
jgi:hypothetical protein